MSKRIFPFSDDLCKGRQLASQALIDSDLESDKDGKRKRFTPAFLHEEFEPDTKKCGREQVNETSDEGEAN